MLKSRPRLSFFFSSVSLHIFNIQHRLHLEWRLYVVLLTYFLVGNRNSNWNQNYMHKLISRHADWRNWNFVPQHKFDIIRNSKLKLWMFRIQNSDIQTFTNSLCKACCMDVVKYMKHHSFAQLYVICDKKEWKWWLD